MKLLVIGSGGREHAIVRCAQEESQGQPRYTSCPATAAYPRTRSAPT